MARSKWAVPMAAVPLNRFWPLQIFRPIERLKTWPRVPVRGLRRQLTSAGRVHLPKSDCWHSFVLAFPATSGQPRSAFGGARFIADQPSSTLVFWGKADMVAGMLEMRVVREGDTTRRSRKRLRCTVSSAVDDQAGALRDRIAGRAFEQRPLLLDPLLRTGKKGFFRGWQTVHPAAPECYSHLGTQRIVWRAWINHPAARIGFGALAGPGVAGRHARRPRLPAPRGSRARSFAPRQAGPGSDRVQAQSRPTRSQNYSAR